MKNMAELNLTDNIANFVEAHVTMPEPTQKTVTATLQAPKPEISTSAYRPQHNNTVEITGTMLKFQKTIKNPLEYIYKNENNFSANKIRKLPRPKKSLG